MNAAHTILVISENSTRNYTDLIRNITICQELQYRHYINLKFLNEANVVVLKNVLL